uniref:Uncharacterized protein n=1 Tax=Theropithecus gelada TaxID=9565 RepID=A0A8D2G2X3_THEGE
MNQGDSNPAAIPHAAEDIQGDDRRISQHDRLVLDCKDKEPDVRFVGGSMVQLMHDSQSLGRHSNWSFHFQVLFLRASDQVSTHLFQGFNVAAR